MLAGPKVAHGSSAGEEAEYLGLRPALAERNQDLLAAAEAEKYWLLSRAAAAVYPTTSQEFRIVPFEAARVGTPCLFAWHTSLAEYLPEDLACVVPPDVGATAARAAPVLVGGADRERLVSRVRMAGRG